MAISTPPPSEETQSMGKQYPYTPDSSCSGIMTMVWQWSSQMYFPGLANYEGRPFDISMTHSNF